MLQDADPAKPAVAAKPAEHEGGEPVTIPAPAKRNSRQVKPLRPVVRPFQGPMLKNFFTAVIYKCL